MRAIVVFVAVVAICGVESSPIAMFGPRSRSRSETIATVDCSNREAMQFVLQSKENFRCVYPDWNSLPHYPASARNSIFPSSEFEVLDPVIDDVPLQFNPNRQNMPSQCRPDQYYQSELGMCISKKTRPQLSATWPKQQFPSQCGPHQRYQAELGLCVSKTNRRKTVKLPEQQFPKDCRDDQYYQSELGLCVSKTTKKKTVKLPEQQFPKDCRDDQYYQSELGLCVSKNPVIVRRPSYH